MYGGGASSRSGGEAWYETRGRFGAANDNACTVDHSPGTGIGALTDAALTIVPWDSTCGPDCLQQSEALSFIGQWSWPALQQAICSVTVAVAPSTHVAHVDVRTATTTSSEASARLQRTILSIVCRGARRVNFVGTSPPSSFRIGVGDRAAPRGLALAFHPVMNTHTSIASGKENRLQSNKIAQDGPNGIWVTASETCRRETAAAFGRTP